MQVFDYLLKTNGIDKKVIDGYRNEEFTHTAVAAQIAGGNADCGLGIYSAAQMYGLDFIELSVEEYDFIVNNDFMNTPMYNAFMEIFHSEELKERDKYLRKLNFYKCGLNKNAACLLLIELDGEIHSVVNESQKAFRNVRLAP